MPVLRKVDGVTMRVPDLDSGLAFYVAHLGHRLIWRNDEIGQAGLAVPDSDTEIILTTRHRSEPNWLVDDVAEAVERFSSGGGDVLTDAFDIPVGRVAAVRDPFGNSIVLVDLSRSLYTTDPQGSATGIE